MAERSGVVTLKGNPVTLVGNEVKVGDVVPDFTVVDGELKPVSASELRGKVCILAAVPSLDTPVCDTETRRFNQEATALGDDVTVAVISVDLPFAQQRWCGSAGADRVRALSDHRDVSFGTAFGVLIKDLRLLARAVFVADRDGVVRHAEIVGEVADEPDYEAALAAVKALVEE